MLPALVLASWWAQADPAPAEPAPAPSVPAATASAAAPLADNDNRLSISAGYARRLGDEGGALGPRNGFSVGGDYEHRLVTLPNLLELSAGIDFRYDRFQTKVAGTTPPGEVQPFSGQRVLSQTSFAATAGGGWRWRRLRPYVQIGAGATIA
ncbi:MAG: hypothetical protein ACJ8F1_19900 [Polyangia bacterium]